MAGKLLLVGYAGETHIGLNFFRASKKLGLEFQLLDIKEAFEGGLWLTKFNWWFRGHHPVQLEKFSRKVVRACQQLRASLMISTGIAPVNVWALEKLGELGARRLNYLTDDPWNAVHRAPWFMRALPLYDQVFSVRKANLENLRRIGCQKVSYLPFAYAPELHYPEFPATAEERHKFDSDVVFIGGADRDRVPYISALIKAGFKVVLYGGYWERFRETKPYARGHADPETMRKAISCAKIALCLVRRNNRDDNSMRTFEIPAIGTCMLTEDTDEHREIFEEEGKTTLYFKTPEEMVEKARHLITHKEERQRLAFNAHILISKGKHTYKDRLINMLDCAAKILDFHD